MLVAARVQPSRTNKSTRMADIIANIEDDDDSRTAVPRRRKRPIVESDLEDATIGVPEALELNPMAPPAAKKKKRNQVNVENPPYTRSIPPLPLKPTSPAQIPPKFQPNLKPRDTSRSQLPSTRPESQESRPRFHFTASANPSEIPDDRDIPMQDYQDRFTQGWF